MKSEGIIRAVVQLEQITTLRLKCTLKLLIFSLSTQVIHTRHFDIQYYDKKIILRHRFDLCCVYVLWFIFLSMAYLQKSMAQNYLFIAILHVKMSRVNKALHLDTFVLTSPFRLLIFILILLFSHRVVSHFVCILSTLLCQESFRSRLILPDRSLD